jgi:hypothetical protein
MVTDRVVGIPDQDVCEFPLKTGLGRFPVKAGLMAALQSVVEGQRVDLTHFTQTV